MGRAFNCCVTRWLSVYLTLKGRFFKRLKRIVTQMLCFLLHYLRFTIKLLTFVSKKMKKTKHTYY